MIYFATKRLIDSVWTLAFSYESDSTVKIHSYARDNLKGVKEERQLPNVKIIEDDSRNIVAVELDNCERDGFYDVVNPAYVFSYTDTSTQRYSEIAELKGYMARKLWPDGVKLLELALAKAANDKEYRLTLTELFYDYSTVKGRDVLDCFGDNWGKLRHDNAVEAIDSGFNHLCNMEQSESYSNEYNENT